MTLEQLYFVSQITAATAVVASIVFLALQVRQNSRLQERMMMEEFRINSSAIMDEIVRDRDFAALHMRIASDYDSLDVIDKYRAEFMAQKGLVGQLHMVLARQAGFVPDVEWNEFLSRMRFTAKRKNFQIVWEKIKGHYPPSVHRVWEDCGKE